MTDLVAGEPDRRLELGAEVRRRRPGRPRAREGAQPPDDVPHALRAVARLRDRDRELRAGPHLAREEVEVRGDRGERVVDLVRDARGEGAEARHPLRELELRLHGPALRDVGHDRGEAQRGAVRSAAGHAPADPDPGGPLPAGGDPVLRLEERGLPAQVRLEARTHRGRVVGVHDPREDLVERAGGVGEGRSAPDGPRRVEVKGPGGEVPVPHGVRAGDREREPLPGLAQPRVERLARGLLPPGHGEHRRGRGEERGAEPEDDPQRSLQRRLDLRDVDPRLHAPRGTRDLAARDEDGRALEVEPLDQPGGASKRSDHGAADVVEGDALHAREARRDRPIRDQEQDVIAVAHPDGSRGRAARHRPALEHVLEDRRRVGAEEQHDGRAARGADRDRDVEERAVVAAEPQVGRRAVRRRDRVAEELWRRRALVVRARPAGELASGIGEERDPEVALQVGDLREDLRHVRGQVRVRPRSRCRVGRAAHRRVVRGEPRDPELVHPPLEQLRGLQLGDRAELDPGAASRLREERAAEEWSGSEQPDRDERQRRHVQQVRRPPRASDHRSSTEGEFAQATIVAQRRNRNEMSHAFGDARRRRGRDLSPSCAARG